MEINQKEELPTPQMHLTPSRKRILEEIKQLGYETQNQILMEYGLRALARNCKYLKKFNGNVDAIISHIADKMARKEEKRKSRQEEKGEKKERESNKGKKKKRDRKSVV